MSEFDSSSGRKGFVRDVMRRISSPAPREDESPEGAPARPGSEGGQKGDPGGGPRD